MIIAHVIDAIESYAPPALQESYDNSGLIIGSRNDECTGALITVDVTENVVAEAVAAGCNLIVAHHPLIFSGLKRLDGSTPQQRAVIAAVRARVAVYACHTSLDSTRGGVSQRMARLLRLADVQPLATPAPNMLKLQVFVPQTHADDLCLALFDAGAGRIGNYDSCSYAVDGVGSYRPLAGADPFIGTVGETHHEAERCLQVVLPRWRRRAVEAALRQVHPYEEPAYDFIAVENIIPMTGLGAVGRLPEPLTPRRLVDATKSAFGSPVARCNAFDPEAPITRVALCGGSGGSLIRTAIAAGAQAFITSDVKYHDFVDYAGEIFIIDIGHHESENCSKTIIFDVISEKFPNFALRYSQSDVNPINYL